MVGSFTTGFARSGGSRGGNRGGLGPQVRPIPKPFPSTRRAPIKLTPTAVRIPPRKASTAYYNPARIIDRSQLTIVDSIAAEIQKSEAEQRGDIVVDPVRHMRIDLPENIDDDSARQKIINPKTIVGALVAAYFLFGG